MQVQRVQQRQQQSERQWIEAACQGAAAGVEATKDMVPKFGKAAVFAAKAAGVADQGAVAGMYMIQGLKRGICG